MVDARFEPGTSAPEVWCATNEPTHLPNEPPHLLIIIIINVPLFKKMRDIIFFLRDYYFLSHFKGLFEGSEKLRPLKKSREMAQKVIVPKK